MSLLPEIKIDTKGLAEPLTKLIDCVSKGIGTAYEPTAIIKKAKAESEASLILANAAIEKQDLLRRAAHRWSYLESRRQGVIEAIVEESKQLLPQSVSREPVSDDWLVQFFEDCKDVGGREMQAIWARILTGEVTTPGRYSRRTLQLLKTFEYRDARAFFQYCSVAFSQADNSHFTLQNGATDTALKTLDSFPIESHLISLGLVASDLRLYGFSQLNDWKIKYFDKNLSFVAEQQLKSFSPYRPPEKAVG